MKAPCEHSPYRLSVSQGPHCLASTAVISTIPMLAYIHIPRYVLGPPPPNTQNKTELGEQSLDVALEDNPCEQAGGNVELLGQSQHHRVLSTAGHPGDISTAPKGR